MERDKRPAWAVALLALVAACAGCSKSSENVGGLQPGIAGPHVVIHSIFNGTIMVLDETPPDWSPDDSTIVFAGGSNAQGVWRVAAIPGSVPVPITNPDSMAIEAQGYTPCFLGDGRIGYMLLSGQARTMSVMAADPGTVRLVPPPTLLHIVDPVALGRDPGWYDVPEVMSLSSDGARGVGEWYYESVYTLDWSHGALVANPVSSFLNGRVYSPVISRDGSRIAFFSQEVEVSWVAFDGGPATVVGNGVYPSWNGDGTLLGYEDAAFDAYVIYNMTNHTSTRYALPSQVVLGYVSLSRDGTRIVFRTYDGRIYGLCLGTLVP